MPNPTPTINEKLPFKICGFDTLVEGLEYAARGETGMNFYSVRGEVIAQMTYTELRVQAKELALRLVAAGFPRHGRVAILAETIPQFHVFFFACQYAGLLPVPLLLPINLGGKEAYIEQIRIMMAKAGACAAVTSDDLIELLREAGKLQPGLLIGTYSDFDQMPKAEVALQPLGADEPCYIQYSSGSTSLPKGVTATQKSTTSNITAILRHGLKCRQGDRTISWLPLYHDMGLVGFALGPLMMQVSIDYIATSDFARRPLLWLKIISDNKATMAFSPSFGYELCCRRAKNSSLDGIDLSSWRVAGIGGDMIRADVLDMFVSTFESVGYQRSTFVPSYGLAEATLAMTFADVDKDFARDTIDMQAYANSGIAKPIKLNGNADKRRTFVICGKPMPGHGLEIRRDDGSLVADREVGDIFISGPSLMAGYFQDEEASQRVFTDDGWMDTGDMGYLIDGELVVTGRSKDLIIVNGRNIWPHDIEWAIERLPEIRSGGVAAFSVEKSDGTESVVTVVECRVKGDEARQKLLRQIKTTIQATAGVTSKIVLAPLRSLTMTSSGKLSRAKVKAGFLAGAFEDRSNESAEGLAVLAE